MSRTILLDSLKKDLLDVYKHAVGAVRPDKLVKDSITVANDTLSFRSPTKTNCDDRTSIDLRDSRIHVIGAGKSALAMACGLSELVDQHQMSSLFSHGTLSVPMDLKSNFDRKIELKMKSIGVDCYFGSRNNLPDENSVKASQKILNNIETACLEDRIEGKRPLFIVLISGGGSACLTSPNHIDLDRKLGLIRFLVQRGADIVELNKVRRYFSKIKGGQLASHLLIADPEARILSFIISDVIGDSIEFIASGPTYIPDNYSFEVIKKEALGILGKYNYDHSDIDTSSSNISSLNKLSQGRVLINTIIGNNMIALRAASSKARLLGYNVLSCGNDLQGESSKIVKQIYDCGAQSFNEKIDKLLVVGGGEATISKQAGESWGLGGRAQEMALDYMILRISNQPREVLQSDYFLAGGTDGQDGPTDVAACMASYSAWIADEEIEKRTLTLNSLKQAKASHNSTTFWTKTKPDWLIKTGITGTNVMDIYLYSLSNR